MLCGASLRTYDLLVNSHTSTNTNINSNCFRHHALHNCQSQKYVKIRYTNKDQ